MKTNFQNNLFEDFKQKNFTAYQYFEAVMNHYYFEYNNNYDDVQKIDILIESNLFVTSFLFDIENAIKFENSNINNNIIHTMINAFSMSAKLLIEEYSNSNYQYRFNLELYENNRKGIFISSINILQTSYSKKQLKELSECVFEKTKTIEIFNERDINMTIKPIMDRIKSL